MVTGVTYVVCRISQVEVLHNSFTEGDWQCADVEGDGGTGAASPSALAFRLHGAQKATTLGLNDFSLVFTYAVPER